MQLTKAIIEAAIEGFERQKEQIDQNIADLRAQLNGTSVQVRETDLAGATPNGGRRTMSAAARKRIAAAQKARWAVYHAKEGAPATKAAPAPRAAPKRKLSAAAKAQLAANLAKARAAKAAKAKKAA
jgi:hypothetical protein